MSNLADPFDAAAAWLADHEADILAEQIAICETAAPTGDEAARADLIAAAMLTIGLSVERDEIGNLSGARPGRSAAAPIVISSHLDTVFAADQPVAVARPGQPNPYRDGQTVAANEFHAPGISDAAAGLAGILAIARALQAGSIQTQRPLLFLATVGEEGQGDLRGARHFFATERGKSTAAFITVDHAEPGMVVHRGVGSRRYGVEFRGPGGHSWAHFGRYNPVFALSAATDALAQRRLPTDPRTTYNIGVIRAGGSVNAIPASATMQADLRSEASTELATLDAAFHQAIQRGHERELLRRPDGAQAPIIERIGERPAGFIPADAPLVRSARAALEAEGFATHLTSASTDANAAYAARVPAIAMSWGGRSDNQHSTREWFSPLDRTRSLRALLRLVCDLAQAE